MKREEILNHIKFLAKSKGFYGRLYEQIIGNEEALSYLEEQNFKDLLDLIIFLEN